VLELGRIGLQGSAAMLAANPALAAAYLGAEA
jgi:ABC-type branched-subunit amino acid transport system ATPase component